MPRASGSSKRQQGAAGHRDTRHDNGLVGPAKRPSGRKSQGQGDNSARSGADHGSGQSASSLPSSHALANGLSKHPADGAVLDNRSNDPARRPSLGTSSETSSESCNSNLGANGAVEAGHRQIDVNALKNVDVHRDSGPVDMVVTVLKSLPIQDTLAILIILMHLPSLSLSVIYAIFTFLTFVPPVTTSSGMNINLAEIFEGVNSMPSFVTVICMDFFFFMIWLFLWQPIQNVVLDLAKPVIAITLGGGTGGKDGSSRGLTSCLTWVVVYRLIHSTRSYWYHLARHIPEHWRPFAIMDSPFESSSPVYDRRGPYGWVKSALGIHILTQGVVRYIREWYLKREKSSAAPGQSDPEAAKSIPGIGISDASHEPGFSTADPEAGPTMLPSSQLTNKKKRKQSAQVRLQQPLWAALASTKIVVMKEYELSHPRPEKEDSKATDIHNLGNAPFDREPAKVWISYIGCDEVCFNTSHFLDPESDATMWTKQNGHTAPPAGVDTSKPFYVRVNNAFWQPTRIFPVEDPEGDSREGTRWTGDIYGLRPSSKYVCEFVDSRTDKVVFIANIRTVKEVVREKDGVAPALPNGQQSLRPDSPATTLRTSIAAAEARLADEKNRLKSSRKDWKTRINNLKKDHELADNQHLTAGNSDEKYKQKIRQQETQKAQAERDTEDLTDKLKNFDTAPELHDRKKKMDRSYSAEKKLFDAAQKDFKKHKCDLESEVKAKEVDKYNSNTRRNKVATRIAKVESELATITDANNRGLNEAERRKRMNAVWEENVGAIEDNYKDRIATVYASNLAKSEQVRMGQAQLANFQEILNSGLPIDMGILPPGEVAPTQFSPWNFNPTAAPHFPNNPWNNSSTDLVGPLPPSRGGLGSFAAWNSHSSPGDQRGVKARGRSSSMLSEVSGFTQSSEEDMQSPAGMQWATRPRGERMSLNGSSGSTGSGSGSGSVPVSPTY